IDVPIVNPDNLYIVAFVQDNSPLSSPTVRRILQSVIVKAPRKVGPVITGIEDNPTVAELRGLVIYPNPASQVVNLHSDINFKRDYTWKLIDQRGVLVMSGDLQRDFSNGDQQIMVGDLANGMYIMTIQTGDRSVVHKKIAIMNRN
ncbi:MAG TPA: T9SS type A sorting domain-containing protein, partial [Chryseolinea sp.]